jgi:hypothetical protein
LNAIERIVALGASNLTRGLPAVISTARAAWGPDVEVLAALGLGRSYGAASRILVRTLPGILDCGLWQELEARPRVRTRGLVTDVGNDILYGYGADRTLGWVDEALTRLGRVANELVITDLPMDSIRGLSSLKFTAIRSVLVPSCRLGRREVVETSERVNAGLARLADKHRARFVHLQPSWYGFDPIHIRPSRWSAAWREIVGSDATADESSVSLEALRLYAALPERQWLAGVERRSPQIGRRLAKGGRLWLF